MAAQRSAFASRASAKRASRRKKRSESLSASMRQFLTPQVWKQAKRAADRNDCQPKNKGRVGKGRPAGSMELRVSPSPSKIPYGGFSPVRLQMDRQWRPSTTSQGLSAVHIHPMIPSYTPPQFVLPEVRDPRRDLPVLEPRGSIWHDSQQRQHVHPEALGSPAGYVVPSGHRLLRPHPPL